MGFPHSAHRFGTIFMIVSLELLRFSNRTEILIKEIRKTKWTNTNLDTRLGQRDTNDSYRLPSMPFRALVLLLILLLEDRQRRIQIESACHNR